MDGEFTVLKSIMLCCLWILQFTNIPAFSCLSFFFFLLSFVKGHKEWLAEVQFLSVVNHPNLVKLLGYCSVDSEKGIQRLLVYEFMSNRSLEDHLFSLSLPHLPWKTRLQIMLGAAQGLHYLHNGLEVKVPCSWEMFHICNCNWLYFKVVALVLKS